jgi:hypothetical protein
MYSDKFNFKVDCVRVTGWSVRDMSYLRKGKVFAVPRLAVLARDDRSIVTTSSIGSSKKRIERVSCIECTNRTERVALVPPLI